MASTNKAIAGIKVGKRHRRDLGDIDALAANIERLGLLHPVVITPDGMLIAGERRLEALKSLGWKSAPVNIVDIDAVVNGEFSENAQRKDFTPSELVAIAATVEERERERARERMILGKAVPRDQAGRTRDRVATPLGVSGKTLEKAKAVVAAAKGDPKSFGKLLEDMDRTGRVNGVYRRLKRVHQAGEIQKEPPPLPGRGPYRVIVADPPWPFEQRMEDPFAHEPYPLLSVDQICVLPVSSIAHEDATLWLWCTNSHLVRGFATEVVKAWGFRPVTLLTWAKPHFGCGERLRGQTEHCIMALRGKPTITLTNQSTLLRAPARAHSQKPVEFYNLVEGLCPAPRYADLFSRYRHNEKWDCHGDEAPVAISDSIPDDLSIPAVLRRGAS